jgi:hypothetical protein
VSRFWLDHPRKILLSFVPQARDCRWVRMIVSCLQGFNLIYYGLHYVIPGRFLVLMTLFGTSSDFIVTTVSENNPACAREGFYNLLFSCSLAAYFVPCCRLIRPYRHRKRGRVPSLAVTIHQSLNNLWRQLLVQSILHSCKCRTARFQFLTFAYAGSMAGRWVICALAVLCFCSFAHGSALQSGAGSYKG